MNKIVIVNDEIIQSSLDDMIKVTYESKDNFFKVNTLKIKVLKSTDLELEFRTEGEIKLDIYISLEPNINFNLYELKKDGAYKLGYKYYILENSSLNIFKINDIATIKEMMIFNLNGENAKVNYTLKTISTATEKYDLMVYHNSKNTASHIINHGVNLKDGVLKFNVSGFIPKGNVACTLDQKNRIINLTNNNCQIKPNLFIDEHDVIANHSAHIGKCSDDSMFYLMSRGIDKEKAQNLLVQGFLKEGLSHYEKEMDDIINKYWR